MRLRISAKLAASACRAVRAALGSAAGDFCKKREASMKVLRVALFAAFAVEAIVLVAG
jgi:hypothetical protein